MGKTVKIGLGIGIAGGGVILLLIFGFYSFESETSESILSEEGLELISNWDYDDIVNNVEKYQGKTMRLVGYTITVDIDLKTGVENPEDESKSYTILVHHSGSGNYYTVEYYGKILSEGGELSEDDLVVVIGTVDSITSWEVVKGESTLIPKIDAKQIKCTTCPLEYIR